MIYPDWNKKIYVASGINYVVPENGFVSVVATNGVASQQRISLYINNNFAIYHRLIGSGEIGLVPVKKDDIVYALSEYGGVGGFYYIIKRE